MADPFIGQIQQFGFNYAPSGWAFCNGQTMAIAQNQALFALLGTMYGGDGVQTFKLPDLQGRLALHFGQSPGTSAYTQGAVGGTESVTLTTTQLPQHTHNLMASSAAKLVATPAANGLGGFSMYINLAPDSTLNPASIGLTGGSQPHENRQPIMVINWCIALVGLFPSRN
jgi:microcystin-dependent protein